MWILMVIQGLGQFENMEVGSSFCLPIRFDPSGVSPARGAFFLLFFRI